MKITAKKLLPLLLILILTLGSVVSCDDDGYENITYREGGIEFFLPSNMRRSSVDGYDFYFSNLSTSIIFTAVEIDAALLSELQIETTVTAEEYIEIIFERNNIDKSKIYYEYDEKRDLYNFRYTYVDEDGYEIFYYIVVVGEPGNLWYIEMLCENEDSETYLSTFEVWKRNVKVYEE